MKRLDTILFIALSLIIIVLGFCMESVARENVKLKQHNVDLIKANERIEKVNEGLYNEIERLEHVSMEAWSLFDNCLRAEPAFEGE